MTDSPVIFNQINTIATITLNRPARLNALTHDLMVDLRDALDKAAHSADIRAVVLTGAGRGFCAGQDLSERDPRKFETPFDLEAIQKELFHPVIQLITEMPKPVIAKVGGIASGAGSSIALAADIVVAGTSAKFAQSFSKVGLSVDAGGGWFLTQYAGAAKARAAMLLGETISGQEAERLGLIYRVVADSDLDETVDQIAQQLANTPRTAVQSIKRAAQAAQSAASLPEYLVQEAKLQGTAGNHPDYAEGILSFLEKRKANFD